MNQSDYDLKVKTLGNFDIVYKDKSIFTDSSYKRSIKLIQFLLYNREMTFSREELIGTIWPDKKDAQSQKAFTNIFYNAHKIIAFDSRYKMDFSKLISITESDGQYGIITGEDVNVDIDALTMQLEYVRKKESVAGLMSSFKAVTNLVVKETQAASASIQYSWVEAHRDYCLDVYARIVECIADKLILNGCFKDAERIKVKCLAIGESDSQILNALIRNGTMKKVLATPGKDEKQRPRDEPQPGAEGGLESDDDLELSGMSGGLLKKIIGEVIKSYMADYNPQYYIALIKIHKDEDMTAFEAEAFGKVTDEQMQDLINKTLLAVLRKRDMYVTFKRDLAIAVLFGVRPEYIDNLKARIANAFKQNMKYKLRLDIQISPVIDVR